MSLCSHKIKTSGRSGEQHRETYFDAAGDAIYVVDAKTGRIRDCNRRACADLGYSRRELLRLTATDIESAYTPPEMFQDHQRLGKEATKTIQGCHRRKDGSTFPVEIRLTTIPFTSPLCLLAIVRDITERKRLEEIQGVGEMQFRSLAENSPDIVDRFDRYYRHLYINPAGARLLGVPLAQVIGKTIQQTGVPEPFASLWEDRVRKVFTSALPLKVSDAFPGPKGLRFFESRCVPEFDSQRRVQTVLVISRDITERKRMEDALRQSEANLIEAQQVARIGNWSYDIAGDRVQWSKELYRIFDVKERKQASPYRSFLHNVHPDDRALVERTNKETRTHGKSFDIDYRIVTRLGVTKTVREVGYAKKDAAGRVVGLFGMAQDITDRKRMEESLKSLNTELEQKVKDRTSRLQALAAELTQAEHKERRRIAHLLHEDLQQRLAAIKYMLHELKETARTDSVSRMAEQVIEGLTEAIELTRNLTTRLSPPVLYQLGFSSALDTLAEEMKSRMALSVRIAGFRDFHLPSYEMQAFAFDAVRELLLNVAKHSGVKSAEIRIGRVEKKRIAVEVRDKGKGMRGIPEQNEHFGLFSIHERAEAMGVGFHISSRRGKGTCAVLTLPIL